MSAIAAAWYRFRATLGRRRSGYLGLAALVGLVGGVALASMTAGRRTDSSYPDFLAGTNPSDLIVQPTTLPPYAPGFLSGQLARLTHVSHVETAAGFNAATLTAAVAWQATVIAGAGLVIGIPLGITGGRWLWLAFAGELAAVPGRVIPAAAITAAALAALILANLIAAVPGRRAGRTPTATVLRAE